MKLTSSKKFEMIRTLTAVGISLGIAFVLILFMSEAPIEAITTFIFGPVTKVRYLGNVVEAAIPLMFSGVAVSLLFQTGLFSMGSEGIFYFSGLIAAIVGITFTLPLGIHPLVSILCGALAGGAVMTFIGYMRAKFNISELVMSLMFNSILYGVGLYILNYYFRETETVVLRSVPFHESAALSVIIPGTRIHSGLIIALVVIMAVQFFLYKTKWGYEIRMVGLNPKFAKNAGINVTKVIMMASIISGMIAGMGGSIEILGMYDSFKWAALPGMGFDGALVAMLAKNKPKSVIISALFLAYIRTGADMMARLTDMPAEMVGIMQGLIILLISGKKFLDFYKKKMLIKEAEANERAII